MGAGQLEEAAKAMLGQALNIRETREKRMKESVEVGVVLSLK